MSKRLFRIFAPQLPASVPTLTGTNVHVVLYRGNTIFGRLESATSESVQVRDLRDHLHILPLAGVEEIVYDRRS